MPLLVEAEAQRDPQRVSPRLLQGWSTGRSCLLADAKSRRCLVGIVGDTSEGLRHLATRG